MYDEKKITNLAHLKMLAEKIVDVDNALRQDIADVVAGEHFYEIVAADDQDGEHSKVYYLKDTLTGNIAGDPITIPKDMVVESGEVIKVTDENPVEGLENGTYIHLVLANAEDSDLYINVADLVNIYGADNAEDAMVVVTIDDYKISADLSDAVKEILTKADEYELPIASEDELGGVKVASDPTEGGIVIAEDGTITLNMASDDEVEEMIEDVFANYTGNDGDGGDDGNGGDTEPDDEQP